MLAVLLSALFVGTGLLAAAVIAANWRPYLAAVRTIRAELTACEEHRDVRVHVREVSVSRRATVLRPNFTAAARRPAPVELPAAA
jgi:hypothetical protein